MLHRHYTRLPKRQRRLVGALVAGFVVLLGNSALLWLFEGSAAGGGGAAAYLGMVVMHVALGTLFTAPALVFVALHARAMPLRLNRAATVAGLFTALSLGGLLGTGFALAWWGGAALEGWVLAAHLASVGAVLLGFAGHVSLKRGVKYHFLEWTGRFREGTRRALAHPFSMVLLAGAGVTAAFLVSAWWPGDSGVLFRPAESGPAQEEMQEALAPAEAALAHSGFLEPGDLMRSESCGQAGCHADVHEQWQESAHHTSSFNNPYYRKTTERLIEEEGVGAARWCASCHDPALLFTGALQDSGSVDLGQPAARAGVTCLTCHATEGVRDLKGNGRYVLSAPDLYPFAEAEEGGARAWMHDQLIRMKPEPHAEAMLSSVQRTAAFCGTCHKVGIPEAVNDYRFKRGQNQYDSWQASGVSGSTVRSFYVPDEAQTCTSCHMPKVPSDDAGAENGRIRSHRFAAANASVPALKGHGAQVEAVREVLADSAVTLDVPVVTVNGQAYGPGEAMPTLKPGDRVELAVAIRNRGVGHRFPAGTNDSNELWLTATAQGAGGEPVLASGRLGPDGRVDTSAHPLGAVLVGRQSQAIGKRDVWHWRATVFSNTVDPGTARLAHYRFEVPPGTPPVARLSVRLRYRKFKKDYHDWVFQDSLRQDSSQGGGTGIPEQPIMTVATATRTAGPPAPAPGNASGAPRWERWNDYGIGLLLEGDAQGALQAFERVAELQPGSPEGPINRARVFLQEGQIGPATEVLAEAERRRPGYLKTAFFRGQLLKKQGAYEQAIAEWKRVAETYPRDRVVLLGIGRLYYQLGRYEEALAWLGRVLEVDPEHVGALYNRMLTLGALGRTEAMKETRQKYQRYKEDERAPAWASAYKAEHPAANREAQPIHYHRLRPVRKDTAQAGGAPP